MYHRIYRVGIKIFCIWIFLCGVSYADFINFSSLPSSPAVREQHVITDAPVCAQGQRIIAGGGTTACPVFWSGTFWIANPLQQFVATPPEVIPGQGPVGPIGPTGPPGPAAVPQIANIGSITCNAGSEGVHSVANNCNASCTVGGTCTAGSNTHCEMYCNGVSLVETGR